MFQADEVKKMDEEIEVQHVFLSFSCCLLFHTPKLGVEKGPEAIMGVNEGCRPI